ncbi:MAG: prepilin-type N-terminal cleavage/methylation domain-containing protein [Steroidobacteraceae bacterium]
MSSRHPRVRTRRSQRGFTLIEIMIALLIGVFMLAALITIVQANRVAYGDQNLLAQLQDNERMAMTLMTDVIQAAGYYPTTTPPSSTASQLLTAGITDGMSFAIGQSITGSYGGGLPGDHISVRYMTASGDGILNCSGSSNTSGGNVLYYNQFYIAPSGHLVCEMNGTIYDLVSGLPNSATNLGVTNMTILYGVITNASATGNEVDTYMNATDVNNAGLWSSVVSVMIELTFNNPLYGTSGTTTQPKTVSIQRVVGLMSQLGPVQ